MSVDTYLRGKNTAGYRKVRVQGDGAQLKVLVAPTLAGWARLELFATRRLTGRKLRALLQRSC
ncbi:MAG TPA: hypothetical protein VGA13_01395 [Acidimicrobiales bacterium]